MPGAVASNSKILVGQLPVPGSNTTSGYLTKNDAGILLENGHFTLRWEDNGALVIYFVNTNYELWNSGTKGQGNILSFQNADGLFVIKNKDGVVIWPSNPVAGNQLKLGLDRSLTLYDSNNQQVWTADSKLNSLGSGKQSVDYPGAEVIDYFVPKVSGTKYIALRAEGGDGGKKDLAPDIIFRPNGLKVEGGEGATIMALFKIGTGAQEIPSGAILRMIIGGKGATRSDVKATGAAGGGGTALLFKRQNKNEWHLLMVAGGGGGAFSDCCSYTDKGSPAETGESGSTPGGRNAGNGGMNGKSGTNATNDTGGGGGAAFYTYDYLVDGGTGWPDGDTDPTIVPTGGKNGRSGASFGFGGGGQPGYTGGGGGGYSGGGGGGDYHGGGGGGSYVSDMAITSIKIQNRTTLDVANGFVEYEITSDNNLYSPIQFKSVVHEGKCLGISGKIVENFQPLELVDCSKAYQYREWVQVRKTFRLLGTSENKCIDLYANRTNPGTEIQLNNCYDNSAQGWIYDGLNKQLRLARSPRLCLIWDETASKPAKIGDCTTDANQKWEIKGVNPPDLGEPQVATIRSMVDQSFCIDNMAGKIENGNPLKMWKCDDGDGNDNQKWFFDNDLGVRLSERRDMCLDLPSTNNNTAIQLYYCHALDHGAASHEWIYDGVTKMIRYKAKQDKCLSLESDNIAKGTKVQIADCNSDLQKMKWALEQAAPHPEDAIYGAFTQEVGDKEQCLDLKNGNASNGADIQRKDCNSSSDQQWFVQDKQIKLAKDMSMCLIVDTYSANIGSNAYIWECGNAGNGRWIFDASYQFIRNRVRPDRCLYVNTNNSVKLATCDYNNPSTMQWTLPGAYGENLNRDSLSIHLAQDEGKCIDMENTHRESGLRVFDCETDGTQYFTFNNGSLISTKNPNICVTLRQANTTNGTDIIMYSCSENDSQKWIYDAHAGELRSKKDPSKCISIAGLEPNNNSNIEIRGCSESAWQQFIIK